MTLRPDTISATLAAFIVELLLISRGECVSVCGRLLISIDERDICVRYYARVLWRRSVVTKARETATGKNMMERGMSSTPGFGVWR